MADENYLNQLQEFLEQKGHTKEETKIYLEEVFKKAFEIGRDSMSKYDEEDPTPAEVTADVDLDEGKIVITRRLEVIEEEDYSTVNRFKQIEVTNEKLEGLGLKAGEIFEEVIDLDSITFTQIGRVKQLFLQKLSEIDKIKQYAKFLKHKNELLTAKIHKILKWDNLILDYDGDSIFMPGKELSPLDKSKIAIGNPLTVFVLEVEEMSKDAQMIASRSNPQFVAKLIEREIEDVHDGVVTIEAIAREAGFKTKVAVSTTEENVDPVGSIIGVKGLKIKPIVEEIGGERLDVIKYHPDIKQFIAEALLPAEITGIKVEEDEEGWRTATVVVQEDQFLPALGKRGLNIKLAAILTKSKLDVKTVAEADAEGIKWEPISKTKFVAQPAQQSIIDLDDYEHVHHEMAGDQHEEIHIDDSHYEMDDADFGFDNNQHEEDHDDYWDPEEDHEDHF